MLAYFYPISQNVSFKYIAEKHVKYLRSKFDVQCFDEFILDVIQWHVKKPIVLHPALYFLVGHNEVTYRRKIKRLDKVKRCAEMLIGFDVADTDRISDVAINVINQFDYLIVPTEHSKKVYRSSGAEIPIYVLPHGVNVVNPKDITKVGKRILELKEKNNCVIVTFFLSHSGFRKGADIVYKALSYVQSERNDVILLVKRQELEDPYMNLLRKLKMIEISGTVSEYELADIYRFSDMVIVPSRGGGFELNALESIAYGTPTVVSATGCFDVIRKYAITIKPIGKSKIFNDNIVHVGYGVDSSPLDLAHIINVIADNVDEYKKKWNKYAKIVRRSYSWDNVGKKLIRIFERIMG